jgi:hypothetical protein
LIVDTHAAPRSPCARAGATSADDATILGVRFQGATASNSDQRDAVDGHENRDDVGRWFPPIARRLSSGARGAGLAAFAARCTVILERSELARSGLFVLAELVEGYLMALAAHLRAALVPGDRHLLALSARIPTVPAKTLPRRPALTRCPAR